MTDVTSSIDLPNLVFPVPGKEKGNNFNRLGKPQERSSLQNSNSAILEQLAHLDKKLSLLRGHHLFGEETSTDKIFELQEGVLFTYYLSAFGYRRIVGFYTAGDLIGVGSSGLHKLACQALSNATVAVFDRDKLIRLAGKDTRVSARLWSQMMTDSQRNEDHILWLGSPAQVRLAGFLLSANRRTPDTGYVDLPMNRRELADFLGLTIETVSRCFTQLRKLGVIKFTDFYRLKIVDQTMLEHEAGLT